jgi:peptidyl-prolyl cis-trans isomerase A (cyclophilin A)
MHPVKKYIVNLRQSVISQILFGLMLLAVLGSCRDRQRLITAEEQLVIDRKIIEDYLAANNITAEVTPTGIYYQVLRRGNGVRAENGKTVRVHYLGKYLYGPIFDSSYATGQPYVFRVGATSDQNSPIKAWHQALPLMHQGDEFRIYVPSGLAYGRFGTQRIPPNANLVFDMDLLEVRN